MTPASIPGLFLAYANRLKFGKLFIIIVVLFIIDLLIPDFITLIDETMLGLMVIILANWKKERGLEKKGIVIEGEIVNDDDKGK